MIRGVDQEKREWKCVEARLGNEEIKREDPFWVCEGKLSSPLIPLGQTFDCRGTTIGKPALAS